MQREETRGKSGFSFDPRDCNPLSFTSISSKDRDPEKRMNLCEEEQGWVANV